MVEGGQTYILPDSAGPLRQGEILSSVEQHIVLLNSPGVETPLDVQLKKHPYAVILTQDCDLAQDFKGRSDDQPLAVRLRIPNILLCEVDTDENFKNSDTIPRGSDIWKRIIQNKDERFQYIRKVTADIDGEGQGTPPLLIDFKHAFTLPTEMLYEQLRRNAKRRTRLTSPYLEHLSSRYAYFISRVALPRDHNA